MNQQEQQIPLSQLLNSETLTCKSCGSKIFRQSLVFKKISKLMAASPTDKIVPIPVLVCDSVVCGSVLTELLEEPLRSELEASSIEDGAEIISESEKSPSAAKIITADFGTNGGLKTE